MFTQPVKLYFFIFCKHFQSIGLERKNVLNRAAILVSLTLFFLVNAILIPLSHFGYLDFYSGIQGKISALVINLFFYYLVYLACIKNGKHYQIIAEFESRNLDIRKYKLFSLLFFAFTLLAQFVIVLILKDISLSEIPLR